MRAPALRGWLQAHPEWWTLAASALAWIALAAHAAPAPLCRTPARLPLWEAREFGLWALMCVAMMFPLLVAPVRYAAARSLWRRRHRAIAAFLLGYLAPWAAMGLLWLPAHALLAPLGAAGAARMASLALTPLILLGWQLTPLKTWARAACHRTDPLAPLGWRADWSCLRFGTRHASVCLLTCWPYMLAPTLLGHSLPLMLAMSVLAVIERYPLSGLGWGRLRRGERRANRDTRPHPPLAEHARY